MNKKLISLFTSALFLVMPAVLFAAALDVKESINRLLNLVVWPVFIGAVVVMGVWAGFLFVTAQGDASKLATARKAVLWTIIGVVVGIAAFSAVRIIGTVLFVGA